MTRRTLVSTAAAAAALFLLTAAPMKRLSGQGSPPAAAGPRKLERIRPSADGTHFQREGSGERFVVWGVNYDHDDAGRLLEDYWEKEWDTVAADFREIRQLGANLVRVHLQTARFMTDAEHANKANLARLGQLVKLAEETGLYLDITGLGCYHKQDVPAWYDRMEEADRWEVQARFWRAVATVCRGRAAVFCYDLMNEPILGGGEGKRDWTPGKPLGGKYFVQRITTDVRGRDNKVIARDWIARLTSAIRAVDDRTMITVGVIPWAQTFKGARDVFYSPEAGGPLDFVSVHLYPRKGKLEEDLAVLKTFEAGKPLLIEEIFPLAVGPDETAAFIDRSRLQADGWVSFYWGKTIEEYEARKDLPGAIIGGWLRRFRDLSPEAAKASRPDRNQEKR